MASVLQTAILKGRSAHDICCGAAPPAPFSAGSGPIMPLSCTTLSGPRLCAFLFVNHFDVFPYLLCLSHLVVRPCSKCFLEEQQHQDTTSRDSGVERRAFFKELLWNGDHAA